MVAKVVADGVGGIAAGDTLAAEENELVRDVAGGVAFVEDVAGSAVPIELAVGLLDALAVTIVGVGDAGSGGDLIFGIVGVLVRPSGRTSG